MEIAEVFKNYEFTAERLANGGILLLTGQGNPMTIGWGQLGIIWSKPVFTVLVRPSRFSHQALERSGEFTVNALPPDDSKILEICGSKSGRDTDKLTLCGLTAEAANAVAAPRLKQASIVYECRVLYRDEMSPGVIPRELDKKFYPAGDYHTIYVGEVLHVTHRPRTPR
jgi:flavin reductase (DIM6/NTAB) family NADH-FMN oxidoreductase RutF